MRVGLLLKRNKPEGVEIARSLVAFLVGRGHQALLVGDELDGDIGARALPEAEAAEAIDLLVILGGDGTLLHGAELVADRQLPILGVNLGRLGFLTTCPPELSQSTLQDVLDGKVAVERRMRLRVQVTRGGGGEELVRYACNDAVFSQGALARLIELECRLDGALITTYRSDGLIISTPTGSTAYSLAAGGPILFPDLSAMVVTPICPHTLTNRPIVLPASARMTVSLAAPASHVQLTVDGQWGTQIADGDRVEVHAANKPLLLFQPSDTTYFQILREKLHWGERTGA